MGTTTKSTKQQKEFTGNEKIKVTARAEPETMKSEDLATMPTFHISHTESSHWRSLRAFTVITLVAQLCT